MTSASVCGPAAGAPVAVGAAAELDGAAGAELVEPWPMLGILEASLVVEPARPVSATTAAAARPRRSPLVSWRVGYVVVVNIAKSF
jgi:hypothetical protein